MINQKSKDMMTALFQSLKRYSEHINSLIINEDNFISNVLIIKSNIYSFVNISPYKMNVNVFN